MENKFEEPKQITDGMKQGLARMYGDTFLREYLVNAISINKHNSLTLLAQGKYDEARDFLSKAKALQQLMQKGKEHFVHFEEIKNKLKVSNLENAEEVKL